MDLEPLNLGMIAGGQGWGVWTGIQEGHDCGWGAGQQAASRCTQYTAGCSRPRAPLRHGHLVICSAVCACHCGALPSSACSCCAHVAPCPPPPPSPPHSLLLHRLHHHRAVCLLPHCQDQAQGAPAPLGCRCIVPAGSRPPVRQCPRLQRFVPHLPRHGVPAMTCSPPLQFSGLQGLLEILGSSSEYDDVPVRPGEERLVQVRCNAGAGRERPAGQCSCSAAAYPPHASLVGPASRRNPTGPPPAPTCLRPPAAEAAAARAAGGGQAQVHRPAHQGQRAGAGARATHGRSRGRMVHLRLTSEYPVQAAIQPVFSRPPTAPCPPTTHPPLTLPAVPLLSVGAQPRHGGRHARRGGQGLPPAAGHGGRHLLLRLAQPGAGGCVPAGQAD